MPQIHLFTATNETSIGNRQYTAFFVDGSQFPGCSKVAITIFRAKTRFVVASGQELVHENGTFTWFYVKVTQLPPDLEVEAVVDDGSATPKEVTAFTTVVAA